MKCTKAIIPVAGYGARRLPVTKTVEKCMLPILNRPVIDYVIQDCVRAGITDIYIVVSPGSTQVQDYYSQKPELEEYLRASGRPEMIELIRPPEVNFHFVEQDTSPSAPYGTTIPVWLCREYIEPDEHVLVLMGDDFVYNHQGLSEIERLKQVAEQTGEGALLGVAVDRQEVSGYGVIVTRRQDDLDYYESIQEKPQPNEARSNLINISKYLFAADFFQYLDRSVNNDSPDGEYQIIDVINKYVADGHALRVLPATGTYLDGGTLENWVAANNFMLQHQK